MNTHTPAGSDSHDERLCQSEGAGSARPVVVPDGGAQVRERAAELAARLGLPLRSQATTGSHDSTEPTIELRVTDERLELREVRPPRQSTDRSRKAAAPAGTVYVDFIGGSLGHSRRVNRFGLLFRAVGLTPGRTTVIDATAGLCQDAFLLAYYGARVTAIERVPTLVALVEDGIARTQVEPDLHELLAERLQVICADARSHLQTLCSDAAPDVVYLDPMFPVRKKSALVRKEMRLVRRLVGEDGDAGELLDVARAIARRRVVVKRLCHAPELAPDPTYCYTSRVARYDVYAC